MSSSQSSSQISSQFWMVFGKYMAPVLSAEGEKINWINYKTGVKHLRFNMQVHKGSVTIAIEINHPDIFEHQKQFELLANFKKQFEAICGSKWIWEKMDMEIPNKSISQVITTLDRVSILNQAQWPDIISFLKKNLVLLDEFWCNFKFAFE